MEKSLRAMIREEVESVVMEQTSNIAEQTVEEFKRHKRDRDEMAEREKNVTLKETDLNKREAQIDDTERQLDDRQKKLEEEESKFKKQKRALSDILGDKDMIKSTLEMLFKRETALKERAPDLYEDYLQEAAQITQPFEDKQEYTHGKLGGSNAQHLANKIDRLEDIVYDRELEEDGVLSLELSFGDEGYQTP